MLAKSERYKSKEERIAPLSCTPDEDFNKDTFPDWMKL